jgi:hypothetical protein
MLHKLLLFFTISVYLVNLVIVLADPDDHDAPTTTPDPDDFYPGRESKEFCKMLQEMSDL